MAIQTLPEAMTGSEATRARNVRRIGLALFAIPVVAAAFGVFGPRETTGTASGSGYELTVHYPQATRSSIVAPFSFTVTKAGGFGDDPVVVRLDQAFVDRLDFQNWYPVPSAEANDGRQVVYEFDPPVGDSLEVSLDARTGPNQGYSSDDYHLTVLDGDRDAATVTFHTVFWP